MFNLDTNILTTLLTCDQGPCLSLYMNKEQPPGQKKKANQIRFKNLVQQGYRELIDMGCTEKRVMSFMQPVVPLLDDNTFWVRGEQGLAIFIDSDRFHCFHLPVDLTDRLHVGARFHIKPLLPLLGPLKTYYVLCLSLNSVRLYQADRYHLKDVSLPGGPYNLERLRAFQSPEAHLDLHTFPSQKAPGTASIFHGHGNVADQKVHKKEIGELLIQVGKALEKATNGSPAPIVLAGVDYITAMFAQLRSIPTLCDQTLSGNPDHLTDRDLMERSWHIVEPVLSKNKRQTISTCLENRHSDQITDCIDTLIQAAHVGKVDTLIVDSSIPVWGQFKPESNTVLIHPDKQKQDEDLCDLAASYTLLHKGNVYAEPNLSPSERLPAVGLLRYTV